jgi:DNA-binding Lrp family transcriptional regulator
MDSVRLSEADLTLVEALQVSPRAPWSAVSQATGMSAVTAARRWQRLKETGEAWVIGTPAASVWNAHCMAYVDIRCAPGRSLAVAGALAKDSQALSVELTAGSADIFLTVAAADLRALSRYLLQRVDVIPGVTDTRTRILTHLYRDGSGWRLGALSRHAASGLPVTPSDEVAHSSPPSPLQAEDHEILVQLGLDGRSSYATLAAAAGVSEATARRRVSRLLCTGAVLLRAEVAAQLAGWTVPVILSIDASTGRLGDTARAIAQLRQVRLCAMLAGTPPLVVTVWLHSVEAIHAFETTLVQARVSP